jgi:hypothetical protein
MIRRALLPLTLLACGTEVTLRGQEPDDRPPDDIRNPDTAPPIAICGARPVPAAPLTPVDFVGELSYDPDENPLIGWRWTLVATPDGSSAALPAGAANLPGFQPDLAGEYVATLVVTDDAGNQSPPCAAAVDVVPDHALWIELSWTVGGDDLDLILGRVDASPGADDLCAPGACSQDWGTPSDPTDDPVHALNDVEGTGPELAGILAPEAGTFTVGVADRSTSVRTSDNAVTLRVWVNGQLQWDDTRIIADEPAYVPFADIAWPSGVVTSR